MGVAAKVLQFAKKSDGTGNQVITGVGFTPRAVILVASGANANHTAQTNNRAAIGFTGKNLSNTIESQCVASFGVHNTNPTNNSRYNAAKAIAFVGASEAVTSEADMSSLDSDGFTLDWTINDALTTTITAIVLGGSSLAAAKAISWASPGSGVTGNQSVTGVGFEGDCLLTARTGASGAAAHSCIGFGATDGSASWLSSYFALDGVSTPNSRRGNRSDSMLGSISNAATWLNRASFVSFDADGFTINWAAVTGTEPNIGLVLFGGSYACGRTTPLAAGTTGVDTPVTGIGFEPSLVIHVSSFGGSETGNGTFDAVMGIGAGDGVDSMAAGWKDTSASRRVHCYSSNGRAIIYMNPTASDGAIYKLASVALDSDGFTWTWTSNNVASGTASIPWLVIGPPDTAPPPSAANQSQIIMVA